MAKFVLKNAVVQVNGVDLSNYVTQVAVDLPDDEVDLSAMQDTFKETGKGLSDASFTVTFLQDFANAKVDATLWPLKTAGTPFDVRVRSDAGARSATNPEYQMYANMYNYNPISGNLGQASSTQVTFKNATQAGVVRLTT